MTGVGGTVDEGAGLDIGIVPLLVGRVNAPNKGVVSADICVSFLCLGCLACEVADDDAERA